MSKKVEVTVSFLENLKNNCKEFKTHGCTYAEKYELEKIIKKCDYYLNKEKK